MKNIIFFFLLAFSLAGTAATTTNYVDADWAGTQSGTAAQPWATMNWTTINTELASGNVIIYFSAREATSLTDDKYDTAGNGVQRGIDLLNRTDTSASLLTIDGKSYYNTNDAAPVWIANSSTNMCVIREAVSQNGAHAKKSNITVHGFRIICTINLKELSVCGDNFTIEQCDASHSTGIVGTGGVGLLIVPTADGSHEGSTDYCPACTNIMIRDNILHDSQGEQIYVGGAEICCDAGSGYPTHSGITITNNEIYNCGSRGDQGDAIDIKAGIKNILIIGNNIHDLGSLNGIRAIVTQGQTNGSTGTTLTIERNYIHDTTAVNDAAIVGADSWGVPQGIVIRNNVLANIGGVPARGIHIYASQDAIQILNNTIYHCTGLGLDNGGGQTLFIRNNLFLNNNLNGNQFDLSNGSNNSDYNAYNFTKVSSGEGAHTIAMSAGDVTAAVVNPAGEDFHLLAGGVLVGAAQVQAGYTTDFDGIVRGASWDIGAYESTGASPPPPSPPQYRSQRTSRTTALR